MRPGGSEPGPDGDGKWRAPGPMPGEGARLGGVALPKPESESIQCNAMHEFFLLHILVRKKKMKENWRKHKKCC